MAKRSSVSENLSGAALAVEGVVRGAMGARIYDLVRETPLMLSTSLSSQTGNRVLLKREDLQQVFSFKIRGAYHKMTRVSAGRLARGVVAASAGNHAQGVALAARRLHCQAAIVMPKHTQRIKISAVRAIGGRVILAGENFDEAYAAARELARTEGALFIPPFDDADVIAGNATIAAEILRQHPEPIHAIFCAVGGGGLLAGVAAFVKVARPETRVIGVEPEDAASMKAALAAGRPVALEHVGIFADAVAVKKAGAAPFRIAQYCKTEIVTVNSDAVCAAIKEIYDDSRVIMEPSGALAAAGLRAAARRKKWRGKTLVALACGANMNFDRLRFVAERADLGENREAVLAVSIPERRGSFRKFCAMLGRRSVTEFNYRMSDRNEAHIFVGVEIHSADETAGLIHRLRESGMSAIDLTGNEAAKLHIRHMVGGRARADNEVAYRFEFPERPGALMNFLTQMGQMGPEWNISMFHYRNHGADVGRVFVGVQVPPGQRRKFARFLSALGYPFAAETDNPAYRMFLRPPTHPTHPTRPTRPGPPLKGGANSGSDSAV